MARDIVVTIPKTKLAEVEAEEAYVARRQAEGDYSYTYFWAMKRVPLCPLRRIYFVWNNAVRAYHEVISVDPQHVWMRPEIHEIDPVPMKGFQGFRYYSQ